MKIKLTVVKCVNFVDYSTRVKQGDNLAPIPFIIVMQCLAELLEGNEDLITSLKLFIS